MRVLVVDDLPANRKLMRVTLEPEGHTVVEAADGLEALECLERESFDAIISDILMPRMDGYRLCFEVRKNNRLKNIPFIISSSTYTSPADAKLALEVGADRYLKKPASVDVVLAALHELAGTKSQKERSYVIAEERLIMKEYSEVLVRKLEEKNSELEKTQAELLRLNRDLEERVKERTAELEKANVELGQANLDLETFNRSVSHDLRSPLTEMQGYAQMLQHCGAEQLQDMGRSFGGKILNAARRMEGLIRDFLKLAQVKEGEIRTETVDVSKMAADITERLRAAESDRVCDFVISPNLSVRADRHFLQIALENLLSNAWKFTAKCNKGLIEFGMMEKRSDREMVATQPSRTPMPQHSSTPILFIRDNGAGFDMAQTDWMFRPFERFHMKADFPGTGIGLSIVQRIITRHGGRIWAEGKIGEGATFYFTLEPSR